MSGVRAPLSLRFMLFINSIFYFVSFTLILSSIQIILSYSSIYSALFLILSFICSSIILFFIECEFLALIFLIVYVGAIAVLFLFIIMMINNKTLNFYKDPIKYFPFAIFMVSILLLETLTAINSNNFLVINPYNTETHLVFEYNNYYNDWYKKIDALTEVEVLGQILYTHYVLEFLLSGLILFLAIIGSVVLTTDSVSKTFSTKQDNVKQVSNITNRP